MSDDSNTGFPAIRSRRKGHSAAVVTWIRVEHDYMGIDPQVYAQSITIETPGPTSGPAPFQTQAEMMDAYYECSHGHLPHDRVKTCACW